MEAGSRRINYSHDVLVVDVSQNVLQYVLCLPRVVTTVGDSVELRISLSVSDGLGHDVDTDNIPDPVRETETCKGDNIELWTLGSSSPIVPVPQQTSTRVVLLLRSAALPANL